MPSELDQDDAAGSEIERLVAIGLPPLTAARQIRRLTRDQLGSLVDLGPDEIGRLESGASRIKPYASALAEALQVPRDVLLD